MDIDPISQTSACFLLGLRSTSLLWGMKSLLDPETRDSWDVLVRSFMEAKDLLLTFRFDDDGSHSEWERKEASRMATKTA
jgi:hypothetical protein